MGEVSTLEKEISEEIARLSVVLADALIAELKNKGGVV